MSPALNWSRRNKNKNNRNDILSLNNKRCQDICNKFIYICLMVFMDKSTFIIILNTEIIQSEV